jgi:hypothetical protein
MYRNRARACRLRLGSSNRSAAISKTINAVAKSSDVKSQFAVARDPPRCMRDRFDLRYVRSERVFEPVTAMRIFYPEIAKMEHIRDTRALNEYS